MYCYFPNKRFGEEKVAWVTWVSWSEGDFLLIDEEYVVCLWTHITAHELIKGEATAVRQEIIETALCSNQTMRLMHQFVWQWFTSYTNTIPLRIWSDIQALLKRRPKKVSPISRSWEMWFSPEGNLLFTSGSDTTQQQLIVFPDIWTMHQQLPVRLFEQPWVARRHSWLTALQKAVIFWGCKKWTIHTLITTPAWVFQDRQSLSAIFIVDMHKRWYKSAKDPRYRTPTVLAHFEQVYWCSRTFSGVSL